MDRASDFFDRNIIKLFPISLYVALSVVFLLLLNNLNNRLNSLCLNDNAFALISFESYKPVWFLVFAGIFIFGGAYMIYRYVKWHWYDYDYDRDDYEFEGMLIKLISIIVILIFIGLHIWAITIPILQAIITVVLVVIGLASLSSN